MNQTRRVVGFVLVGIAVAPLIVSSTPPLPAPSHWFQFQGSVIVEGGGPVDNYPVVLLGRGGGMASGEWKIMTSWCVDSSYGYSHDVALTDPEGEFYLSVWTCDPPDSLTVAVVLPGSMIIGEPWLRHDLEYHTIEKNASYQEEGSGCEDATTVDYSYVSSYKYRTVEGVTIVVP